MEEKRQAAGDAAGDDMTLEQGLREIEGILEQMQGDDVSLEESFRYYQEGMERLRHCEELIRGVEQKVKVISGEGELQEFQEG